LDSLGHVPALDATGGFQERRRVHLPVVQTRARENTSAGRPRGLVSTQKPSSRFFSFMRKKPRPGSGLPARRVIVFLLWGRRVSQAFFLLAFLYLLTQTAFRGSFAASSGAPVRLPLTVEAFLLIDPFVALLTFLATHTIYSGLFWSLSVVFMTLVVGRAFCGWICPFGTIHHITSALFPSNRLKGKTRVDANLTKGWQVGKYYGMVVLLGAALFGSALGGLFDPICVAVRAIGLGVLPVLQYMGIRSLDSAALNGSRSVQQISDGALDFVGAHVF